jgi:hypothetical protein
VTVTPTWVWRITGTAETSPRMATLAIKLVVRAPLRRVWSDPGTRCLQAIWIASQVVMCWDEVVPIEWVDEWTQATGAPLSRDALEFLTEVAVYGPGSAVLWSQPGRAFERLALEGPLQAPRLVTYFRAEVQRPGLLLAFEWPVDQDPTHLSFAVWLANLLELLDQAGSVLPDTVGTDGIARA